MPDSPQTVEFEASHNAVRAALIRLRSDLQAQHLSASFCDAAELVLAEILNNVVEHASAGVARGRIRLATSRAAHVVTFELHDNGAAMPGFVLPAGTLPALGTSPADLPEGGFGWHLIRSLARDLEYRRAQGWNCLRFSLIENVSDRTRA